LNGRYGRLGASAPVVNGAGWTPQERTSAVKARRKTDKNSHHAATKRLKRSIMLPNRTRIQREGRTDERKR
jgi:hypothetical protein